DVARQPGYLGVHVEGAGGRLVVAHVEPDSPAARAGLRPGDEVQAVAGLAPLGTAALRELLRAKAPGEALRLTVRRQQETVELTATLGAPSRPLSPRSQRAVLGVQLDGNRLDSVTPGMPAAAAGLKPGDVLVRIDHVVIDGRLKVGAALEEKKPGDAVTVVYRRDGKEHTAKATLAAEPP